jgi:RNA polymerase sigma factor (sigma-70 family)
VVDGQPNWDDVYRWALSAARKRTSDIGLAQDAAGHALLRLWEHEEKWHHPRLEAWVRRVAINFVIDQYRRTRREQLAVGDEQRKVPDIEAPNRTDVDDPVGEAVTGADLEEIVASTLTPKQWELWRMKYVEGLPDAEIAARLGLSHGTVRNQLSAIRRLLKAHLGLEDQDDE